MMAGSPSISVVVTTCAGSPSLVRCIRSILACDYKDVEVIVVDNRPRRSTASAVLAEHFARDARVRYAPEARRGLSYARNAGLELAEGEIVAFTDDDVVVDGGWLRAIAHAFAPAIGCVTGSSRRLRPTPRRRRCSSNSPALARDLSATPSSLPTRAKTDSSRTPPERSDPARTRPCASLWLCVSAAST